MLFALSRVTATHDQLIILPSYHAAAGPDYDCQNVPAFPVLFSFRHSV